MRIKSKISGIVGYERYFRVNRSKEYSNKKWSYKRDREFLEFYKKEIACKSKLWVSLKRILVAAQERHIVDEAGIKYYIKKELVLY